MPARPPQLTTTLASDGTLRFEPAESGEESLDPALALPPPLAELAELAARIPPFRGAEFVDAALLATLWETVQSTLQHQLAHAHGSVQDYLRAHSTVWHLVGRVHFHLAERKDDPARPFAFLATYTTSVGTGARVQHRPLGQACKTPRTPP